MQEQMKRSSETREAENAEFQQTVTDQRLTQIILRKALDRMRQVYALVQQGGDGDDQPGGPHIQTSATKTDPGNGPARFSKYEKHAGGGRVLDMLETVVADSKKVEDEALSSEYDAQTSYEMFMLDNNKAIEAYTKNIMNMQGAKAKAEEEHVAAKDRAPSFSRPMSMIHGRLQRPRSSRFAACGQLPKVSVYTSRGSYSGFLPLALLGVLSARVAASLALALAALAASCGAPWVAAFPALVVHWS